MQIYEISNIHSQTLGRQVSNPLNILYNLLWLYFFIAAQIV